MPDLILSRNDDDHRYEGRLGRDDGRLGDAMAVIDYRLREDVDPPVVVMTNTEVPESLQGQGVGSQLVALALDDVRKRGEKVLPECPFVRSWLDEHPDQQDLLDPHS